MKGEKSVGHTGRLLDTRLGQVDGAAPIAVYVFSQAKKRKITKLLHFNTYWRQFLVITAGLEAHDTLLGYDKDDYFWSGI